MAEPATTEAVEAPRVDETGPIARPNHFVFMVLLLGFLSYRSGADASVLAHERINRPLFYVVTIVVQWLIMGAVVYGVRRHKSPLTTLFGERWHSMRDFTRDIGIAAAFWLVSSLILSATINRTQTTPNDVVQALLPHGPLEIVLWIAMSVTAGICEEAIYRGYLQRQVIAYTKSPTAGILGSAVMFGAAHAYKGGIGALRIVLFGAMFGVLAYWRKSVRPGMIAHAFTDSFAGVLARVVGVRVT